MPNQPTPPARPHTPPPAPPRASTPQPAPPPQHAPPQAPKPSQEHGRQPETLPIGARPSDPNDPQSAKFEAHAGPPFWNDPKAAKPKAPPPPDGMTIADEQRERAADVEAHGHEAHGATVDQRPDDEKPTFDPHALAGGGAYVKAGSQKQIPGVAPPAKRS